MEEDFLANLHERDSWVPLSLLCSSGLECSTLPSLMGVDLGCLLMPAAHSADFHSLFHSLSPTGSTRPLVGS
jgi:hypothetical protein